MEEEDGERKKKGKKKREEKPTSITSIDVREVKIVCICACLFDKSKGWI